MKVPRICGKKWMVGAGNEAGTVAVRNRGRHRLLVPATTSHASTPAVTEQAGSRMLTAYTRMAPALAKNCMTGQVGSWVGNAGEGCKWQRRRQLGAPRDTPQASSHSR